MSKRKKDNNSEQKIATEDEKHSRRKAIKSIGIAGGVAAVGSAAPASWTKPLVQTVILPAHATISAPPPPAPFAGVFATGPVVTMLFERSWWRNSNLLDGLIPAAHAFHDDVGESVCGESIAGGGTFEIQVAVDDTDVAVCFSSLGSFGQNCTKQGLTTLSGTAIADFSITPFDGDIDEGFDLEEVVFTNLQLVNEAMVTGTIMVQNVNDPSEYTCVQDFVAEIVPGGTFTCSEGCASQNGIG